MIRRRTLRARERAVTKLPITVELLRGSLLQRVARRIDSTLLGDGVRVLSRIMRKITQMTGSVGAKLRDRSRSAKLRLLEIGRVVRSKGPIIGRSPFAPKKEGLARAKARGVVESRT